MGKKRYNRIVIFLLLILGFHITFTMADIYLYGKKQNIRRADAALVLGAAAWNTRPSPVFRERINHGIWLYKNGYVDKIIFTGGKRKNVPYSEALVAREYAIKNAVPQEDIYIEEISMTTYGNIKNAADIINEKQLETVLVVSDPLHMKRAMKMAEDKNLEVYSSPTPTTGFRTLKTKLPFLFRELAFYLLYEAHKYYAVFIFSGMILVAFLFLYRYRAGNSLKE